MKNKFLKLALYCQKFGFITGTKILIKIFFGKRDQLVSISLPGFQHPIFLRAKSSDEYIFQQIFIQEEYAFISEKKPETIIDAGANIGFAAVYFSNKFPSAKIICLEPESTNYALLKQNTSFYTNIISIQKGLWDKPSTLKIIDGGLDNWGFTVQECPPDTSGAIEATSLNEIMDIYSLKKLSIVKMDIEGSEKEVLSAKDVQQWLSKCDTLVIELHDRMREGTSKSLFEALRPYEFILDQKGENLIYHINH